MGLMNFKVGDKVAIYHRHILYGKRGIIKEITDDVYTIRYKDGRASSGYNVIDIDKKMKTGKIRKVLI